MEVDKDRMGLWSWIQVDKAMTEAVVIDGGGQDWAVVMDGDAHGHDRGCGHGWRWTSTQQG